MPYIPLSHGACHSHTVHATLTRCMPLSHGACHSYTVGVCHFYTVYATLTLCLMYATLTRCMPLSHGVCRFHTVYVTITPCMSLSQSACHSRNHTSMTIINDLHHVKNNQLLFQMKSIIPKVWNTKSSSHEQYHTLH